LNSYFFGRGDKHRKSNEQLLTHSLHDMQSCDIVVCVERPNMLQIALMLLLLVGFFGLFAGLVFFSQGVIEPESPPS